ncbi:hypothetical protein, partial [Fischerella muscicola]
MNATRYKPHRRRGHRDKEEIYAPNQSRRANMVRLFVAAISNRQGIIQYVYLYQFEKRIQHMDYI